MKSFQGTTHIMAQAEIDRLQISNFDGDSFQKRELIDDKGMARAFLSKSTCSKVNDSNVNLFL